MTSSHGLPVLDVGTDDQLLPLAQVAKRMINPRTGVPFTARSVERMVSIGKKMPNGKRTKLPVTVLDGSMFVFQSDLSAFVDRWLGGDKRLRRAIFPENTGAHESAMKKLREEGVID